MSKLLIQLPQLATLLQVRQPPSRRSAHGVIAFALLGPQYQSHYMRDLS